MALPKKGSRDIVVNGHTYRWMIKAGRNGYAGMNLVVSSQIKGVQPLVIYLNTLGYGGPELGLGNYGSFKRKIKHVSPKMVRQVIEYAVGKGWGNTPKKIEFNWNELWEKIDLSPESEIS